MTIIAGMTDSGAVNERVNNGNRFWRAAGGLLAGAVVVTWTCIAVMAVVDTVNAVRGD